MTTLRQWLVILLIAGLGAMAGCAPEKDCAAIQLKADISKQAAELCTNQLVGCSLNHEQIKQVLTEQVEANTCK